MQEKDPLLAPNQPETASEKLFSGINGVFFWDSVQKMLDHHQLLDPGFGRGWFFLRGI